MARRSIHITGNASGTTFATWDPAKKGTTCTLTNGNLTASGTIGNNSQVLATIGKSSGKWYWEVTVGVLASNAICAGGIATTSAGLNNNFGSDVFSWGYATFAGNGEKWHNGAGSGFGVSYTTGDVIRCALDMNSGIFQVYKNASLQGTLISGLSGTQFPSAGSIATNGYNCTANFGATAFAFSVPVGYNPGVF